jgi:ATP-dependent Clp protease ATP-binding subunit ClpA
MQERRIGRFGLPMIDSVPVELDEIERRRMQLQIEREALS